MAEDARTLAREQFGRTAEGYVASASHAAGDDLAWLLALAAPRGMERVLDMSTGAGHTALAFAPRVREVVAVDLARPMLVAARRLAAARGAGNVRVVEGDVERLPVRDRAFDVVTCRIAAHHYPRLPEAVAELARALRPGGVLLVEDNVSPSAPEADAWVNAFERVRDPSHVRAWSVPEWTAAFAAAGLAVEVAHAWRHRFDLAEWAARSGTPPEGMARLRRMLAEAPAAAREAFDLAVAPAAFSLHKAIFRARHADGGAPA